MIAAAVLAWLSAWEPYSGSACADSAQVVGEDFWRDEAWGPASPEPCDVDEFLLFPVPGPASSEASERASFSVVGSGGLLATTTRHQARREGWRHRLEVRGGEGPGRGAGARLERRELAWSGEGWKIAGGDLPSGGEEDLAPWPRGLPRRVLPSGWRAARAELPFPGTAARLQGVAAGVLHPGWKAYALRAWNPVESGREPAWARPWTLSHSAAGLSTWVPISADAEIAPWTLDLHLSDTRVSRRDADSGAERMAAARLASAREDFALWTALLETRAGSSWALGLDLRRQARSRRGLARAEASLRQRGASWLSAWDPAVPSNAGAAPGAWGAGEYRFSGALPLDTALALKAEHWRAWNPGAGTARQGARLRLEHVARDFRLEGTGTWRAARAASGDITEYRALELEGRTPADPRARVRAWRAWSVSSGAARPTATGLFVGLEPGWNRGRAQAGCAFETDRDDRLEATAQGGVLWKFARGWNVDAGASLPWGRAREARGRVTLNFNAEGEARD